MLLLTDRAHESAGLKRTLGGLRPCAVVALHQALGHPAHHGLIICDVSLDNLASLELVHAALHHLRPAAATPVLCLTRDPSVLTQSQAEAIGATAILPFQTPPAQLTQAARTLLNLNGSAPGAGRHSERGVQASVQEAGATLTHLFNATRNGRPIAQPTLEAGADAVLAAVGRAKIRAWLDIVWKVDDVTYQHCLLVAGLVSAFALKLGLTVKAQRMISQAALLHDIGKASIPLTILNKPGRLLPAEMTVMQRHPGIGHRLLLEQGETDPLMLDIVRHHHEYLDGSGYPDGLSGKQIGPFVRLVTICDIYAALIERRPYKAPASPDAAFAILLDMGRKLDGDLVASFRDVMHDS